MSTDTLVAILAIIAIGAYFQTVTGFGFGMIVIGMASGLELVAVPVVAAVISLLTLVNSGVALKGRLHHIDWPAARAALVGAVPSVVAGVMLLDYLSVTAATLLKFLLGVVIAFSGIVFALRPTPLAKRSHDATFLLSGIFSGVFAGLFGVAGPPVILHFYRQPMELLVVRNMLILIFAFTSAIRAIYVGIQGGLTTDVWLISALGVALVVLATMAGRRFPPPLAPNTMRRFAFGVLILIGASLILAAATEWQHAA